MGQGGDRAEDFLSANFLLINFTSVSECSNGMKITGKLEWDTWTEYNSPVFFVISLDIQMAKDL